MKSIILFSLILHQSAFSSSLSEENGQKEDSFNVVEHKIRRISKNFCHPFELHQRQQLLQNIGETGQTFTKNNYQYDDRNPYLRHIDIIIDNVASLPSKNPEALYALAELYEFGSDDGKLGYIKGDKYTQNIKKDEVSAIYYYKQSAHEGFAPAMKRLHQIYSRGELGQTTNLLQAKMYLASLYVATKFQNHYLISTIDTPRTIGNTYRQLSLPQPLPSTNFLPQQNSPSHQRISFANILPCFQ